MKLSYENQFDLLAWAGKRCEAKSWPTDSYAIGQFDDAGTLRAVYVFNAFYDDGASMHIATDGSRAWASRDVFARLANWAFNYRRLSRIEARVPAANRPALITAIRLGFEIGGRILNGAINGTDAIMLTITRESFADLWTRKEQTDG